ncbi:hypothetical protein M441DRAFT_221849 [Trichoderma asperellum CBS 433.97]|uniref:Uncharacterized protein n=1 Tax=Trichoderma asperellum (strain ATCC 204424 / CBS 433.97 / NBRC 101777) TaxID=1042311 RepID=A0A2T3ZPB5_TRIA4|nr:hypothetical protein M441DRAFT_221849 [Trichoderma asperellum CBS 433.97]PTB46653.1 hypothetical protein M441DRAFT_221849 [Trichoderma asperellum CBS 433.97]
MGGASVVAGASVVVRLDPSPGELPDREIRTRPAVLVYVPLLRVAEPTRGPAEVSQKFVAPTARVESRLVSVSLGRRAPRCVEFSLANWMLSHIFHHYRQLLAKQCSKTDAILRLEASAKILVFALATSAYKMRRDA